MTINGTLAKTLGDLTVTATGETTSLIDQLCGSLPIVRANLRVRTFQTGSNPRVVLVQGQLNQPQR